MTRDEWLTRVNEIMSRDWGITLLDAGMEEDEITSYYEWMPNEPAEFVAWFADKYDLIDFRDPITGRIM